MRLTKENLNKKIEKKKTHKNKSLIEQKSNIKYKIENTYLQEKIRNFNNNLLKEKIKEKNLKDLYGSKQFQSNTNIYKNNSKIQNKLNSQIRKDTPKYNIYTKNKTISLNANNNINIGNNINIITNNIHENNNNNSKKESKFNNNLINRDLLTDYNLTKKSENEIYNNINNLINQNNNNDNERFNRIKEATGNENRRFKGKNTSMEHRYHRYNKEIVMSDGDLMTDEDNIDIRRNHIYSHPYKYKSPNSIYNNTYKYKNNDNNIDGGNNNLNNYNYIYRKNYDNLDEKEDNFYNNYYKLKFTKKSFNNNANNRNKYSTIINYKDSINNYKYTNDLQSKTSNSFYVHKSPINTHNNMNKDIKSIKDYSNDNDDDENIFTNYMNYMNNKSRHNKKVLKYKGRYHSMLEENDLPLSPYKNYANTNNNYLDNNNQDEFKSIRRSKNRIRIVKKNNNTSIQEYNLSLGVDNDNEAGNYLKDYNFSNNRIVNDNLNKNNNIKKYYNHFSGNIQPITNNQFIINSNNMKTKNSNENYSNNSKNSDINNSKKNRNNISSNDDIISNSKSINNIITTPNFSDTGKTPKRQNNIINQKVKPFNNNEMIENNNSNSNSNSKNEENSQYKIMVKKRPKNDIPVPLGGLKRRNSSSLSINKNLNKNIYINYEICQNGNINFIGKEKYNDNKNRKNENKFIFDNEKDIIDYIYNKFEEERKKKSYFNRKLRFTGFVLSKKYKGKNLYDVRIEDDINKINQQLKVEKVLIGDKQVEFNFIDDKKENNCKDNNDINNNNVLIEENKQLKLEREKLNKKDSVKNELIKKLDKEKQNFIEEIEKLKNEIEELKKENNKLNEEKNNPNNKKYNFVIEKNILFDIYKINEENKINKKNSELIDICSNNKINNNSIHIDDIAYNDIVNYNSEQENNNKQILLNNYNNISNIIYLNDKIIMNNNLNKDLKKEVIENNNKEEIKIEKENNKKENENI